MVVHWMQEDADLREQFLRAVERVTPEVFQALRDEVVPIGSNPWQRWPPDDFRDVLEHYQEHGKVPGRSDNRRRLLALFKWAQRFNILTYWIVYFGWSNAHQWSTDPDLAVVARLLKEEEPSWEMPDSELSVPWDPTREIPRRDLWPHISPEIARVESEFKEYGYSRPRSVKPEHFEWLAYYQCRQLSYGKVAFLAGVRMTEFGGRGLGTVKPEIVKLSKQLGFPVRTRSKPGPPKVR